MTTQTIQIPSFVELSLDDVAQWFVGLTPLPGPTIPSRTADTGPARTAIAAGSGSQRDVRRQLLARAMSACGALSAATRAGMAGIRPNASSRLWLPYVAISAAFTAFAAVQFHAPLQSSTNLTSVSNAEVPQAEIAAAASDPASHAHYTQGSGLKDNFGIAHPSAIDRVQRATPPPAPNGTAQFLATRYRLPLEQTAHYVHLALEAARDFQLDPLLILAIMSIESSLNPSAASSAGAQGLMQVHTRVHTDMFKPYGGAERAFDPRANIRVGAQILRGYIATYGTVAGALKAYVGAARLPEDGGYAAKVLRERERLAAAADGRILADVVTSPKVQVRMADARRAEFDRVASLIEEAVVISAAADTSADAAHEQLRLEMTN